MVILLLKLMLPYLSLSFLSFFFYSSHTSYLSLHDSFICMRSTIDLAIIIFLHFLIYLKAWKQKFLA